MKSVKIIYWTTTVLVGVMMLFSTYMYFTAPDVKQGFVHLGFPDYFRVQLAIAKLLGALALLLPFIPARVKEWAYAGFAINFISAFIAHIASGDPVGGSLFPLVLLAILAASYISKEKLQAQPKLQVA